MLELMTVEGVFDLEAGVEAEVELEVVGLVEEIEVVDESTAELDDWTEEGMVD